MNLTPEEAETLAEIMQFAGIETEEEDALYQKLLIIAYGEENA